MSETRRYVIHFGSAMAAYAVVLTISILLIQAYEDAWWRYFVAVAPVVPIIFAVMAVVRRVRTLDELQQRIQLEALAFAFCATAIVTFTYGFLELVGLPHLDWLWVFPLMCSLWAVGLGIASWRYR
ncbi:MAG: hypothetical protein WBH90_11325 [Aggregatilineales bacterium]|nr:hypothetical protein [Chloroflexota bacterium]HOA25767.1 hypothetical protein [Aggregatilineales bacterium]HPV08607.1 hypothetical protein [Aggregatilineales bacterium]HQE18219.1 hypothetical protein [Aggregatilineales bacterium]